MKYIINLSSFNSTKTRTKDSPRTNVNKPQHINGLDDSGGILLYPKIHQSKRAGLHRECDSQRRALAGKGITRGWTAAAAASVALPEKNTLRTIVPPK